MNFSHLLNPDLIICDLKGSSREEIYFEMLKELKKTVTTTQNIEKICDDIISHEELIGMANEFGVAIPHTRSADVDDLHIIIGIHKDGVMLKSIDTNPTHVVVMCLISKSTSNTYLLTLRAISKYFMTPGNLNKVIKCKNSKEVQHLFLTDKLEIKHTITAEDIMNKDFPAVTKNTCVKEVIDIFTSTGKSQVAVIDEKKCLIGCVSIESILKSGIPEYILMMNNLKFLPNLEPFENLLANEDSMQLSQFMHSTCDTIAPNTPIIQVIVKLVKREASYYYVVNENNIPMGVITYQELVKNILRG